MKILIDGDGCPVVDITVEIANKKSIECIIVCDTSHLIEKENAQTITVSRGTDSVDYYLVNLAKEGDIVVTQDYGLAAMCLAKGAIPIRQDGMIYTNENIDALLLARHTAKKIRNAGGRLKGPKKRDPKEDENFKKTLLNIIEKFNEHIS